MKTKDEALKLALEALETIYASTHPYREDGSSTLSDESVKLSNQAITAIKEALEQSEQKPFTYYDPVRDAIRPFEGDGDIALYTSPPKREWVGLTDGQIQAIHDTYYRRMGFREFHQHIEAKLKELNHAA